MYGSLKKVLVAGGVALAVSLPAAGLDLAEAYKLALRNDPALREAEANYRAAKEASPQAWSAYLPQLTGSYTKTRTNQEGNQSFFTLDPSTNLPVFNQASFVSKPESTNYGLTLRQTLFNWARIENISAAQADVGKAQAQWDSAQQSLIVRTADAYFNDLAAKDALESAKANRESIGRQLEQSKKRFEVGLIAITDVQESQAAYDQATADEIAAERGMESAREALRAIIGTYGDDLQAPGDQMPLEAPQPESPEAWVKLAMDQNLDLVAARFNAEAAASRSSAAWGNHLPTLDLVASRTKFNSQDPQTIAGVPAPSTTDTTTNSISLQLNVPLFAGGASQSAVRQARYLRIAADEQLERVSRETERSARDALFGVQSEMSRVKALKQSLASSETALKATEAGFEVGTRTTVDVLDARRKMYQARTNYARSKYDYVLNNLKLKQAAGMLTEADVEKANSWLK